MQVVTLPLSCDGEEKLQQEFSRKKVVTIYRWMVITSLDSIQIDKQDSQIFL